MLDSLFFSFIHLGTNILLVTVTGAEAVHASRSPKAEIIQELDEVFKDLYGAKAVGIEDILVPTWISDPLQFGMYGSWPIGVTSNTFRALRLPVGSLYFAGEYTSEKYYGYLHGSWFEGVDAANSVFRCMKQWTCPDQYRNATIPPLFYSIGYDQQ